MIRPFDLRDLALIRRLNDQVITLHTEFALTNNRHPLRGAITSMLVGGQFPTYVWKAEERDAEGYVQLHLDDAGVHAHMVRAALQTDNAAADGLWLSFLDQLIAELGSRGVQSVIAEVNENGEELMWLKQAGFAVYTRQDIWISQQAGENDHADIFRPRQSLDDWDIQLLYAHTVPPMVQLVEPLLTRGKLGFPGRARISRRRASALWPFGNLVAFFHSPQCRYQNRDVRCGHAPAQTSPS